MGGIAFRAPVLATIFLVVALATLAMPGSANFVGEFLILLGVFKAKLAIAVIAFSGVVMASVYALRVFIRAMHNRVGKDVKSRDLTRTDALVLVPLLAVIVFLALYPQGALKRTESSASASVAAAHCGRSTTGPIGLWPATRTMILLATLKGPHVDFAALSPLIALFGGAIVVLLVGLLGSRWIREQRRAGAGAPRAWRLARA